MTYAIDVSHHQNPTAIPWEQIAKTASVCICRATYGTMRDRQCAEHMRRARAAGMQVGLYSFFRSTQSVSDQLAVFRAATEACGYQPGDIAPAIDVEDDPKVAEVSPSWEPALRAFSNTIRDEFGDAMIYITQRDFGRLGKPAWILSWPLWVAHYTGAAKPATPGNVPAVMWQHRVAGYDPTGPGGFVKTPPNVLQLDQNRILARLPLCTRLAKETGPLPQDGPPEHDDWAELRASILGSQRDRDQAGIDSARLEEMADLGMASTRNPGEGVS